MTTNVATMRTRVDDPRHRAPLHELGEGLDVARHPGHQRARAAARCARPSTGGGCGRRPAPAAPAGWSRTPARAAGRWRAPRSTGCRPGPRRRRRPGSTKPGRNPSSSSTPRSRICWIRTGTASLPAAVTTAMTSVSAMPWRSSGVTARPRRSTSTAPASRRSSSSGVVATAGSPSSDPGGASSASSAAARSPGSSRRSRRRARRRPTLASLRRSPAGHGASSW